MRASIHDYYLEMAELVSTRATSPHRKVGAVFVIDTRVIATGYNGSPRGFPHETEIGCPREELKQQGKIKSGERYELCTEVHAEINCIIQCALYGVSCEGATLYCSTIPCKLCARALVNAKIKEVYIITDDMGLDGRDVLAKAKIPVYMKKENGFEKIN